MEVFKIREGVSVACSTQKTPSGFKHVAILRENGTKIASAQISYFNRTWERYTYESVLRKVLNKFGFMSKDEVEDFLNIGQSQSSDMNLLKSVGMIAALGDFFGKSQKESNDWKARMLKAGLEDSGLIMPEDWNTLSEDEKEARLNGALEQIV